jgi:hypothetical protein
MTDRDLGPGLPEIELTDLPRPIDSSLIGARIDEERPDLAHVVIDDRLAAAEAQRSDQLADALPGQPRVTAQQVVDLILKRIELRARRRAPIARRRRRAQRRPHRVARQPRPPRQLLDRDTAHEVLPAQLSPSLHAN